MPNNEISGTQWGSIAVAAVLLDVSQKTVRRRIADGTIAANRVGPRLIRVNLSNLDHVGRPLQNTQRSGA